MMCVSLSLYRSRRACGVSANPTLTVCQTLLLVRPLMETAQVSRAPRLCFDLAYRAVPPEAARHGNRLCRLQHVLLLDGACGLAAVVRRRVGRRPDPQKHCRVVGRADVDMHVSMYVHGVPWAIECTRAEGSRGRAGQYTNTTLENWHHTRRIAQD